MKKKLLSLALALTLVLALVPAASAAGQFTDVPDSSPFASAVLWAVEQGVTKGTSATTFSPGNPCTVSHILTFLWRGNGRPGDAGDERAAVAAWASGLGMDASDLGATCTRATAVYDMWLAAGKPEPAQTVTFSDVPATAAYAKAVSWAVEKGVTNGTGADTFSPDSPCTRGHVAAFLYRAAGSPAAEPAAPAAPAAPAKDGEVTLADMAGIWRLTRNGDGSSLTENIDIEISGTKYTAYQDGGGYCILRDCTITGFRRNADGTYTFTRTGTLETAIPDGDYQLSDGGNDYVLKEIDLEKNYFLNSAGDRYERAASFAVKDRVLSVVEGARGKPVTQAVLTGALWTGDNDEFRQIYKFDNNGGYSLAYVVYKDKEKRDSDSILRYCYEEGTYTLSGKTLSLKHASTSTVTAGVDFSRDTKSETKTCAVRLASNGVLWLDHNAYGNVPEAKETYNGIKELMDIATGAGQTPAQPQGQTLDGYWTGGYTVSGTTYTDIFYFNGSNYAEGTTTQASDGSTVIIYEEGTYRLDGGRIYFTSTQTRGWMRGKSTALDSKTYDWAITQNGNTMVLNSHTYAHVSDPTQASALLAKSRSLTGAR